VAATVAATRWSSTISCLLDLRVYIAKLFSPRARVRGLLLSLALRVGFFTRPLGGLLIGAMAIGPAPAALMLTIGLMASVPSACG